MVYDIDTKAVAKARGGFWIDATAKLIPVAENFCHTKVLEELGVGEVYEDAFNAGWVRVTFCGEAEFTAEVRSDAAIPALYMLASLARHYGRNSDKRSYHLEITSPYHAEKWPHEHCNIYDDAEWESWHYKGAGDKLSRRVCQLAAHLCSLNEEAI